MVSPEFLLQRYSTSVGFWLYAVFLRISTSFLGHWRGAGSGVLNSPEKLKEKPYLVGWYARLPLPIGLSLELILFG